MRPAPLLAALAASLLAGSAAWAQEVIQAGPQGPPPAADAGPAATTADPDQSPEAIGAWARGVMARASAGETAADPARQKGCAARPDRRPHGEVWGGIGNRGYREAGAALTAPIGRCASATVVVDKMDVGRRGRR
jgi:hypothetical protein